MNVRLVQHQYLFSISSPFFPHFRLNLRSRCRKNLQGDAGERCWRKRSTKINGKFVKCLYFRKKSRRIPILSSQMQYPWDCMPCCICTTRNKHVGHKRIKNTYTILYKFSCPARIFVRGEHSRGRPRRGSGVWRRARGKGPPFGVARLPSNYK